MREVTVLGLGNVLLGDDGVGIVAVHRLLAGHQPPPGLRLLDGGTLGLGLLDVVCEADVLVLVDAVNAPGAAPGTVVRVTGDDIDEAVATRLSPHQVGVADLLGASRFLGRYPAEVVLLGIVPRQIDLDLGLSPPVAASLPGLVAAIRDELARLEVPLAEREHAPPRGPVDIGRALGLAEVA